MINYLKFGLKVLAILVLVLAGYYFGYLKPHQETVKKIASHYSNLVKNRTAYVDLAKLDPEDSNFDVQKSNLISIIKETNTKGLEKPLNDTEKDIFVKQNALLEKVFATGSYNDGVVILKSEESIKLLTDEADLINSLKK